MAATRRRFSTRLLGAFTTVFVFGPVAANRYMFYRRNLVVPDDTPAPGMSAITSQRADQITHLRQHKLNDGRDVPDGAYDVVVIGGGVSGLHCAVEARERGLSVVVLEQGDFGEGGSGKGFGLLENGFGALQRGWKKREPEQLLRSIGMIRESRLLAEQAPHLITTTSIVTLSRTYYDAFEMFIISRIHTALTIYAGFQRTKMLSPMQVRSRVPGLPVGSTECGGVEGNHRVVDGRRYCLGLARTAKAMGAVTLNHTRVHQITRIGDSDRVLVLARDVSDPLQTKGAVEFRAKRVINASGPWSNDIRAIEGQRGKAVDFHANAIVGTVKLPEKWSTGPGVVLPESRLGVPLSLVALGNGFARCGYMESSLEASETLQPQPPSRIPVGVLELIVRKHLGLPAESIVAATSVPISYLCRPDVFPATADVMKQGYGLDVSEDGTVGITSHNYLGCRLAAKEAVKIVMDQLGKPVEDTATGSATNERIALVGAPRTVADETATRSALGSSRQLLALPEARRAQVIDHLWSLYGTQSTQLLVEANDSSSVFVHPDLPMLRSEVMFAHSREFAEKVSDVLDGRWNLMQQHPEYVPAVAKTVTEILGDNLGWCKKRRQLELSAASRHLDDAVGATAAGVV